MRQKVTDLLIRAGLAAREPSGLSNGERDQERGDREDSWEVLLLAAHRFVAKGLGRRGCERTLLRSSLSSSKGESLQSEQEGELKRRGLRQANFSSCCLEWGAITSCMRAGRDATCGSISTSFLSLILSDYRSSPPMWARLESSLASLCTRDMHDTRK